MSHHSRAGSVRSDERSNRPRSAVLSWPETLYSLSVAVVRGGISSWSPWQNAAAALYRAKACISNLVLIDGGLEALTDRIACDMLYRKLEHRGIEEYDSLDGEDPRAQGVMPGPLAAAENVVEFVTTIRCDAAGDGCSSQLMQYVLVIDTNAQQAVVNKFGRAFCGTTPLCTMSGEPKSHPDYDALTVALVRKESIGQACSSRVAARSRASAVNTFFETAIMSVWNFETIRSGPENFMLVGKMGCFEYSRVSV
jgi:hypothetical protein